MVIQGTKDIQRHLDSIKCIRYLDYYCTCIMAGVIGFTAGYLLNFAR